MSTQSTRRAIHAYVSDNAHDHWHDFAAEQGVSVSAILEVLAGELDRVESGADPLADVLDDVVTGARRVDASRRRRTTG
ncbi:MAG: hypothetical protein R2733_14095 [Acidimicrobiales bacterium]